jgi:SNF2 family DNA or RNA helicase
MSKIEVRVWWDDKTGRPACTLEMTDASAPIELVQKSHVDSTILPMILEADASILRGIESGLLISWSIKISEGEVYSRRLSTVTPHLFLLIEIQKKLYPFQSKGVEWLLAHDKGILADDMGLGKTVQVLAALQKLIFNSNIRSILLLAPNSLVANWAQEMKLWAPSLTASVLELKTTTSPSDLKRLFSQSNVLLASYSAAESLSPWLNTLGESLDLLICDEAHKLRKPTSRLYNSVKGIAAKRTWLLTGTPLERDEQDVETILSILEPEKFSFKNSTSSLMLKSHLSRLSLRREKFDVLNELPKVTKRIVAVDLSGAQRSQYEQIKTDIGKLPHDKRISLITKLVVATCETVGGKNAKIEAAIKIIADATDAGQKVIIFSNFNTALQSAKNELNRQNIKSLLFTGELNNQERQISLSRFKRDPGIPVLLMNARVGSEGLTVTQANHVIFLNEWWNPSSNRQAEDRVNRIGQKNDVTIYLIRANNTIDCDIADILDGKQSLEQVFLSEITTRLE